MWFLFLCAALPHQGGQPAPADERCYGLCHPDAPDRLVGREDPSRYEVYKQPHSIITKKTKKMVREQQEYIDGLLARRPIKPFPFIPEEIIQRQDPKEQEETRALQARIAAHIKVVRDEEEDILEQHRVKGYAETEVEVEDNEE
nr:unnamed protein product [Digitaria exilis]